MRVYHIWSRGPQWTQDRAAIFSYIFPTDGVIIAMVCSEILLPSRYVNYLGLRTINVNLMHVIYGKYNWYCFESQLWIVFISFEPTFL